MRDECPPTLAKDLAAMVDVHFQLSRIKGKAAKEMRKAALSIAIQMLTSLAAEKDTRERASKEPPHA